MAFNYDMEVFVQIPAAKFFKALVLDFDNLVPKIVPQHFMTVQIVEGDGTVGSIKHITFGEASGHKYYVKGKIDALDEENFTTTYTIMEGDALEGKYEKVCNEVKVVPTSDGGCIYKAHSMHYPIGGYEIKEEEIEIGHEKAKCLVKGVEAYLLANPDAY